MIIFLKIFFLIKNDQDRNPNKTDPSIIRWPKKNVFFFNEQKTFKIQEKFYIEGNSSEKPDSEKEIEMEIFAGNFFMQIISREKNLNLLESLNLKKNQENIDNAGESEGGKSGEFFFSSFDNKLMIKTVKKKDFQIFYKHFHDYFTYLLWENTQSYITKVKISIF